MAHFAVVILICSVNVPPANCQPETALDVVPGPNAQNEIMCGLLAQSALANTAIKPQDGLEYAKIVCKRTASVADR
jgi:hypothetical protein